MSKCIVETSGDFMLLNDKSEIHENRPSVTPHNSFVEQYVGNKKLKVFAVGLPNTATDEKFLEVWLDCKKDRKMAVASFCSLFGLNPAGEKIETEGKAGGKKQGKKDKDDEDEGEKKPTLPLSDPDELAKQKEEAQKTAVAEIEKTHLRDVGDLPLMREQKTEETK